MTTKSVLSQNGYVLKKEKFAEKMINEIKKELTAIPNVSSSFQERAKPFPIYWEDQNYIGLPRQYAVKKLGLPDKNVLPNGDDIDVKFLGKLRPIQKKAFDTIHNACKEEGGGILSLPCGFGKCFDGETLLRLYNGDLTFVKNLKPGQCLLSDNNTSCTVTSTSIGKGDMFKIEAGDFASMTVNAEHILCCWHSPSCKIVEITVGELMKLKPVDRYNYFAYRKLVTHYTKMCDEEDAYNYGFNSALINGTYKEEELNDATFYMLVTNVEARVAYLNGYINGIVENKDHFKMEFYYKSRLLNMFQLLSSLCIEFEDEYINGRYVINMPPFVKTQSLQISNTPVQITPVGESIHYGLIVTGSGRFYHWDSVVVHNTVTAIALATALKKKTLIIVHKEFLMNQWVESIEKFTTADIGIIRQKKVQVDDKDFVVGMLQSLASRKYPKDVLGSFGTVIIDECHHMGAPTFSKAFFKTTCKNIIGLSATVNRTDGMSHVFMKHIGSVKYQVKRENDSAVKVVVYKTRFQDTKMHFTWQKKISHVKMITDLVNSKQRNEFVLHIMRTLNVNRNILVLSERRKHLEYLSARLIELEPEFKTGFYVGGMKEKQLDETKNNARIIFATYQMAEEGFDCKKLDTLIMATPKKRIEQTVGRILRKTVAERDVHPLIIDITDNLSNFLGLYYKRLNFYKRMKYDKQSINFEAKNYLTHVRNEDFETINFDSASEKIMMSLI